MLILLFAIIFFEACANEITDLRSWLEKGGSELFRVDVEVDDYGQRRLIAKQDIQSGHPVLMIKYQFVVGQRHYINDSPSSKQILDSGYPIDDNQLYIAMYMMEQVRKNDSYWNLFIATLPKDFYDFPVYYNDEYLNLLKGHSAYDAIIQQKANYAREWEGLIKICPQIKELDMKLEEYIYWRIIGLSRSFGLTFGNSLVPFAGKILYYLEFINCEPNGHVQARELSDTKDFYFRAIRPIKKGEEIFFTYSTDGNEHYLIHYGYASLKNHVNHFKLIHCIQGTDPFYSQKYSLFNNIPCQSSYLHNRTNTYREALSIARIINIDNKADLDLIKKQKQLYNQTKAISITNEIKTLTKLISHMQDTLNKLPTSIEEDQAIIENPDTHYVRQFIAIYTMMEKQVLKQNIGFLEQALAMMNKSSAEIKKIIKYQTHKDVKIYMNEEILPLKMKDEL